MLLFCLRFVYSTVDMQPEGTGHIQQIQHRQANMLRWWDRALHQYVSGRAAAVLFIAR